MQAVLALLQTETALIKKEASQLCPTNATASGNTTVTPLPGSNTTNSSNGTTNSGSTNGSTQPNGTTTNQTTNNPGTTNGTNAKPTVYFSDLDNPIKNWIYGQVDPQVYYQNVNQLITNSTATLCPKVTPYATPNGCIACP